MKPNQQSAYEYLAKAQQAMKAGDWDAARHLAEQASYMAPELEEVWLLMGALSAPHASTAYLEKALSINPHSERAIKGLLWAYSRMEKEQEARSATRAIPLHAPLEQPLADYEPSIEEEYPTIKSKLLINARELEIQIKPVPPQKETTPAPSKPDALDDAGLENHVEAEPESPLIPPVAEKKISDRQNFEVFLILLLSLFIIGLAGLRYIRPAAMFFRGMFLVREHGPAWSEALIEKASFVPLEYQPTHTPLADLTSVVDMVAPTDLASGLNGTLTVTPTIQNPTETQVAIQLTSVQAGQNDQKKVTLSPLPTDTPALALVTPVASRTPRPLQFVPLTSTPDLHASPTPLPTDTDLPAFATKQASTTALPTQNNAGRQAVHWIDVNLTTQMLYAYEGDTLVNSFLVSSGTWQFPTVTGEYQVYGRAEAQDMSGPGYYLPDVPYVMYFYEGYAIHGTYWHTNFGTPMSHGCINMVTSEAEWIYNWSSIGTLINIHY